MWFMLGFLAGVLVMAFVTHGVREEARAMAAELSENAQRFRRLAQDRDSGDAS